MGSSWVNNDLGPHCDLQECQLVEFKVFHDDNLKDSSRTSWH